MRRKRKVLSENGAALTIQKASMIMLNFKQQ
jgi:hypothetical protein